MPDPIDTMRAMHTLAEAVPHHLSNSQDLVLHDGRLYRITAERLEADEAREALETFITEGEQPWKS